MQTGLASSDPVVDPENLKHTTGTGQQPSLAIPRTDAGTIDSTSHESSVRRSQTSTKPKNTADAARGNLNRLFEAQQEPETPISTAATNSSSSTDSSSSAAFPVGPSGKLFQNLKQEQEGVALNPDDPPRVPRQNDFPGLSMEILPPIIDVDVRNIVIMLYDDSKTGSSLHSLALRLQKELPESAFILLQASQSSSSDTAGEPYGHQGEAQENAFDTGFLKESRTLLVDVIKNGLIAKCRFSARNIILLGHCNGGTTALATAASWEKIEFGGVISIGGAMPAYIPQISSSKANTPALILSGAAGNINDTALEQIRENFTYVEPDIRRSSNDKIPEAEDMKSLLEFFAHRLKGEEWTKQSVISFDGGGIRGYGSLLILQDLMNKIGEEEKRSEPPFESSFAPYDYKPMLNSSAGDLDNLEGDGVVATATQGLPNSSLFLPCHYFTYAAGTSTGGLISIMLFRFRMTVDDCIREYITLGGKVFGNPRPLAMGAILWHKFNSGTLEAAIEDVTHRYSEPGNFEVHYAMDEDVCRSMVLAYADKENGGSDYAYPFRTYPTRKPLQRSKSRKHSETTGTYGPATRLPIWQVARATSAAPTYFRPIKIKKGNEAGFVTFKDGGFGTNNPSEEVYRDVIDKHGGRNQSIGPFISIGTGIPSVDKFSKRKGNINNFVTNVKAALKLPSRTTGVHRTMEQFSKNDDFPYFRFDGGERLGEIALDEWKGHRFTKLTGKDKKSGSTTLDKIYVATAAYILKPEVQTDLTECARILVRRRQLRMRNSSEWDRYASFSYYDCNVEGCDRPPSKKAHDFREHLRKFHQKIAEHDMEQTVKDCRRVYWKYRPNSPDSTPPTA